MYLNRWFPRSLKPLAHLTQLRTALLWFLFSGDPILSIFPYKKFTSFVHHLHHISHLDHSLLVTSLSDCSAHRIWRISLLFLPYIHVGEGSWSEPLLRTVLCWCTPQDIRTMFFGACISYHTNTPWQSTCPLMIPTQVPLALLWLLWVLTESVTMQSYTTLQPLCQPGTSAGKEMWAFQTLGWSFR